MPADINSSSGRKLRLRGAVSISRRTGSRVGTRIEREGIGANVLGDPRIALTWLANELSQHGMTLARDQVVTTGTCLVPLEVMPGDKVSVDYGSLGQMTMQLA